jgi:SPASM domain peptide maturase of grasp-with-spasm system
VKTDIFKLFANCIPVKGARRSLLCDLQTGRMKLIPNGLYEILTQYKNHALPDIKAAYDNEYDTQIDEYFEFLDSGEWGFWCDSPDEFPELAMTYDTAEAVNNAIIDIDANSDHDILAIAAQLQDLGCRALQVRFFTPCPLSRLREILQGTAKSKLRSLEILIPFDPEIDEETLKNLCREFPRICRLVVHSAPEYKTVHAVDHVEDMGVLIYHTDVVTSHECCGIIDRAYFTASVETFTEARHHNNCLHKKISVDARGYIRNCPSMRSDQGHVSDTSLKEALDAPGLQDAWHIHKDQIEICKDCEFRYVCTDCRAYLEDKDNPYAKPAKCAYDPYTATWSRRSTVSLVV